MWTSHHKSGQFPVVNEDEEEVAIATISKNLTSDVSREEIFRVEQAVWKMKFRPPPLPFVPMTVEEASSATDLSRWTNTKVRVIGSIEPNVIPWLVSVDEEGGPYRVALDLTVIDPPPPFQHLVQVFGSLEIETITKIPQIRIMFFRRIEQAYLIRYRSALEAQQPFVPTFIKKKSRQHRRHEDCNESIEEVDPDIALLMQPCYRSSGNQASM
ncbi:hypothetical protein R5R35_011670 [Gryllus longicercus]|uniref:Uncharacterized protein n=1 Tax=Gryllus longicercus TaxID=2509291 RepID=A0AAN9VDR9_9ORTH